MSWADVLDEPDPNPAEKYKRRIESALAEHYARPVTAAARLAQERRDREQKRRAEGRKKPVDLLRKSLDHFERLGYYTERTEHYDAALGRRFDLFGCVDAIAIGDDMIAIQTTSTKNLAARRTKMLASPGLKRWLKAGGRAALHGWSKDDRERWQLKEVWIDVADL